MTSSNKLSLKQFIKMDQSSKQLQNQKNLKQLTEASQLRALRNQKRLGIKQNRKLKLNTLPCEQIQDQKNENQKFLFRSTWQGDIQYFKQELQCLPGGCTSPTFATQIMSNTNNHSSLFPAHDNINQKCQEQVRRNSVTHSRSKSKNHKSLQKFIGDNITTQRISKGLVDPGFKQSVKGDQERADQQQSHLHQIAKLESMNQQLRRQSKRMSQKHQSLKEQHQKLQQTRLGQCSNGTWMSNQQLYQKMKNQSFWKLYLKAQKMIRSSLAQNNQQPSSVINFMKELQALRGLTSEMKRENKSLKRQSQQKVQQLQANKDRLSVQQAQLEQMRLKCLAYEAAIKKLREELRKGEKQMQTLTHLHLTLAEKDKASKQSASFRQQLEEQRLLNSQCQKQRVSIKKKYQQQQEQINSLNRQLSSLKTSYNLLQIQRQEMSANKKQLIQKEKLKEKVHHLQKQIKAIVQSKQNQIIKQRKEYELRYSKQIQLKQSHVKELDQKVQRIVQSMGQLQRQNSEYSQLNKKLSTELKQHKDKYQDVSNDITTVRSQKQAKLGELSSELNQLNRRLQQQSDSIQNQSQLIKQLQSQINQKQELIKMKQQETQRLRESFILIKQQQSRTRQALVNNSDRVSKRTQSDDCDQDHQLDSRRVQELEEYVARLEDKHNQALEMYQKVYNQKVQIQLQLQYFQQQKPTGNNRENRPSNQVNQNLSQVNSLGSNEEIIALIQSLLTIKEEIIKKILVFCPIKYKQLIIEYIYYGDMIKEKYLEIMGRNSPQNQRSYQQDRDEYGNRYKQEQEQSEYLQEYNQQEQCYGNFNKNRTIGNKKENRRYKSQYNKTRPYQYPKYTQQSDNSQQSEQQWSQSQSNQQQINQLMERFLKIGELIERQTKKNFQMIQRKSQKDIRRSQQVEYVNQSLERRQSSKLGKQNSKPSKQLSKLSKQNSKLSKQYSKLSKQYSKPIKQRQDQAYTSTNKHRHNVQRPQNPTQQTQFHYRLAENSCQKRAKPTNKDNYQQGVCYRQINQKYRQPLQTVDHKTYNQSNRPPFISNNLKSYSVETEMGQNKQKCQFRSSQYEQQISSFRNQSNQYVQKPGNNLLKINEQTPYQKGSQNRVIKKNNFNHGIINNLSLLKMVDKLKQ